MGLSQFWVAEDFCIFYFLLNMVISVKLKTDKESSRKIQS